MTIKIILFYFLHWLPVSITNKATIRWLLTVGEVGTALLVFLNTQQAPVTGTTNTSNSTNPSHHYSHNTQPRTAKGPGGWQPITGGCGSQHDGSPTGGLWWSQQIKLEQTHEWAGRWFVFVGHGGSGGCVLNGVGPSSPNQCFGPSSPNQRSDFSEPIRIVWEKPTVITHQYARFGQRSVKEEME